MTDLLSMLDDLDNLDDNKVVNKREGDIVKAPFNYPGGKSRAVDHILPALPCRSAYIEPFGGGGTILLARKRSRLEVYNDRYSGVVDFYRCLRDPELYDKMIEQLELMLHSREEFEYCKNTWEAGKDLIERAVKWYYTVSYSFGAQGRNFGRAVRGRGTLSGKIQNKLEDFYKIHERLKTVQIENQDWSACLRDYDDDDAVFYCDPPYYGVYQCYKNILTPDDHRRMLDTIFNMSAFVAVSSYPNELYDKYDWDDMQTWHQFESTTSLGNRGNGKDDGQYERKHKLEALYIKEAC